MAKMLTPKQRVMKKYPQSFAQEGLISGNWYVYRKANRDRILGAGPTANSAWNEAAKRFA